MIIIVMTIISCFIFLFIVNNITIHGRVNPAQVLLPTKWICICICTLLSVV